MSFNQNKKNKVISNIKNLLESHKADSNKFTHISMGGVLPCGKYYFEDYKDLKKLYKFLGKALKMKND